MEVRALRERIGRREDQLFLVLTLVIGAIVGLTIVAFILATERAGLRLYPSDGAPWRRLAMPIIGALITGYLLYRYFPDARGSGIPQTKTALFAGNGTITARTVIGKFICSSGSLASGIALGREGPSVHIGAGIASVLARWLGLKPEKVKSLLPVGAAAALAAAFNTPIAAVLFSLEEVMGDLHAPLLGSVVLSSATSWMVLHLLLGDEPLFHVPAYHLVHPIEFGVYAVLGVAGGLVSVAFVKLLLWLRLRFLAMPARTVWFQPAIGGLLVGVFGWFVPQVLGVGYTYVGDALNGNMAFRFMALLVVLKVIATATSYSSGNAGGIFGPSLFIGAMTGGAVGSVAHWLLPQYTADVGAYALVGMGTAFAGIVRVPLTSVIMIFEMTRDYTIIVPLMISNLVSFYISYRLQRTPIYEALAHQLGIHLPSPATKLGVAHLRVSAAMRLPEGLSVIAPAQSHDFPHVHSDHSLDVALHRMGSSGVRVLPVVSRSDVTKVEGVITLEDILRVYGLEESQNDEVEGARGSRRETKS
jgi:chloride channel protein, CIC family